MSDKLSDSKYIVVNWKIAQNMRTKKDELELLLYDMNAQADEDCIVDVTAQSWSVSRRGAQQWELDKVCKILANGFLNREN